MLHRIGGSAIENLRLKPPEIALAIPGISVIMAESAEDAADELVRGFPHAVQLHETARTIASASIELIRTAGFDVMANPTRRLPNHHRIIHNDGVAGFSDENLVKLSRVFTETRLEGDTE